MGCGHLLIAYPLPALQRQAAFLRWQKLWLRPTRCNPGQSNKNGSIEARNNSLKKSLDQALRLRGTLSFETRVDYEAFVEAVVQRMNSRVAKLLAAERAVLKPLTARRTAEFEEIPARVSKFAVFNLKGMLYSVPSQLVGHRLMVRLYAQHVEGWLGVQCVVSLPRAKPLEGQRLGRSIDYKHLVGA